MPTVRISEEHYNIVEEEIDRMENETGITAEKKQLVENAIEEKYGN